jgi:hypothetical protein
MRNLGIVALGAALVGCASSVASARDLSKNEQSFVAITATAPIVAGMCNAHVVPTSFIRIADMLGVDDAQGLFKATLAAMDVLGHREYRREDLIPAVTRFVGELADTVAGEFSENKPATCKRYLELLRKQGAVE